MKHFCLICLSLLFSAIEPAFAQNDTLDLDLFQLQADDGVVVSAFMMYPKTGLNPASPGIVFHHGGPGGHGARLIGAARYGAEGLAKLGYTTISIVSRHSNRYVDEPLENAALDVKAAVEALAARGIDDIILVGNSFGSVRVSMYQRDYQDPRVKAMVHVAPTFDLNDYLKELSDMAPDYDAWVEKMRRAVKDRQGHLPDPAMDNPERLATPPIFQTGFGRPQTAATLLNWWGPDSDNQLSDIIGDFDVPQFLLGGTADRVTPDYRFEELKKAATKTPRVDYKYYPDGDHYFNGYQADVIADTAAWLKELGLGPAPRMTTRFIDNRQQIEFNGVIFNARSPGLHFKPDVVEEKTAFLLLGGWKSALLDEDVNDQARALAGLGYGVVVPQLNSDGYRGSQSTRFARMHQDIADWLAAAKAAGYDKVIGIGQGYSAIWIAAAADLAEKGLSGLVLVNPAVSLRETAMAALGKGALAEYVAQAEDLIAQGKLKTDTIHMAYQNPASQQADGLERVIMYPETFLAYYGPDAQMQLARHAKDISVPVLAVAGANRFYASPASIKKGLKGIPKSQLTFDWRADQHISPDVLADAVATWLAKGEGR
ncbi:MAG: alpha/beta fold hydrolase [Pseudomonadota bacterium]